MTRTELLGVRMTAAELAALRNVADERCCSVGAVVRWAVKAAVIGNSPGGRQAKNEGSAKVIEPGDASLQCQS